MSYLPYILILATFGGTLAIHFLKNFLLKEKRRLSLDWDGLLERLAICYIIIAAKDLWIFIPIIIVLKIIIRLLALGFIPGLLRTREPGSVSQKVLIKAELAFDLFLSPLFAIIVGVIFK